MKRLNVSILKCLRPDCEYLPRVEIKGIVLGRRGFMYTPGQALTCEDDIEFGRQAISKEFPQANEITETRFPGWLSKAQIKEGIPAEMFTLGYSWEHGKIKSPDVKKERLEVKPPEEPKINRPKRDENAPASEDEIAALQQKWGGRGRRR